MNQSNAPTIEQVLFERMGVSVENALATAGDVVDEKVATAVDSGIDVDARITGLGKLLEQLTEPATVTALGQLLSSLPQLMKLAKLADEMPNVLGTLGDIMDDYQQRLATDGIDVEKSVANGLQAVLYLGSKVDGEHLERIGDLLGSDILNPHALNIVDNAARSLNSAQEQLCETTADRIGMFGMLRALRDPQIQRSLAFAVQFGKCFGRNLDANKSGQGG